MAIVERSPSLRGPVRMRCTRCTAAVRPEADRCSACDVERPPGGWQKIAELVVHRGGRDAASRWSPAPGIQPGATPDAQVRTVYLQPLAAPGGAHGPLLAMAFFVSFFVTTSAVLGLWGFWFHLDRLGVQP